ncbi:kinase-like protein [Coprinopsis marcescibilis]|uniref:Kinase-like protein n=1 Tax=Coprinopsis marcescibilis TaxID=230819 RepID=A0A5C3KRC4_COPMA|nr:kinase-like protein [Coprinopsis marcescibilis]
MPDESPLVPFLSQAPLSGLASATMGAPKFIGAVKDEWKLFSDRAEDYTMGAAIGFGASSIVYQALWKPVDDSNSNAPPTPCALKVLDLDSLPPRSLQLLQRETTLMSLSKHPNVLRVRGSWMEGHRLYIALRLMNKGSAADVMRYGWPGGMDEEVIKCILRQALKGLNYLHVNGFIHRDIKAANLLIDDDGTVLLGDLGVAADLSEHPHDRNSHGRSKAHSIPASLALAPHYTSISTEKRVPSAKESAIRPVIGKRKSFVGTPCWMAPELISGKQYDASADIWSFGITALELAQGHPPRFRESAQKVLLRTLQEEAPSLNRDGGQYKYTRAFKEMVDSCLAKDPSKRPTAEQLLQLPFFRSAKKKSYLVNAILKDLPPLAKRQERRALSPANSPNSIDSWDFPTAMGSPGSATISMYRYAALEELSAAEDREHALANEQAVFEMDGEGEAGDDTTPLPSASHAHVHYPPHLTKVEDQESDNDLGMYGDDTGTSGTESTREVSTAPSSYVAAPSFQSKESSSSSSRPSTAHSSTNWYDGNTVSGPGSRAQALGSHSTEPALSKILTNPGSGRSAGSGSGNRSLVHSPSDPDIRKRQGLWRKLTSKVGKRPGSRDGSESGGGSVEKPSKLSSLFASASRG